MKEIVEEAIRTQARLKLTDKAFAMSIGIHRVSWLKIKRTKRLSFETIQSLCGIYPSVKEVAQKILGSDLTQGKIR